MLFFNLLDLALKEGDWEEVVYIRSRIRSMIQEDLEGFLVRSRTSQHAEVEAEVCIMWLERLKGVRWLTYQN